MGFVPCSRWGDRTGAQVVEHSLNSSDSFVSLFLLCFPAPASPSVSPWRTFAFPESLISLSPSSFVLTEGLWFSLCVLSLGLPVWHHCPEGQRELDEPYHSVLQHSDPCIMVKHPSGCKLKHGISYRLQLVAEKQPFVKYELEEL